MCQIIVKQAGTKFNLDNLKKAQKHNEDGYSITWWENDRVNVIKTFDFNKVLALATTMKDHTAVFHMRYTTRGATSYENLHPFDIPSGYVLHNGTMHGLGNNVQSDTSAFAGILNECDYTNIEDIEPLIRPFINDKINRLVFFEDTGRVTIMNKALGIVDGGLWYSNDYHLKPDWWSRKQLTKPKVIDPFIPPIEPLPKQKVFVYGTLKRGLSNHSLLKDATYLGKANTVTKWAMVGLNAPFPYVLEKSEYGYNVAGEVYCVTPMELKRLDSLEGFPFHYIKQEIAVMYADDNTLEKVTMYTKANFQDNYLETEILLKEWGGRSDV